MTELKDEELEAVNGGVFLGNGGANNQFKNEIVRQVKNSLANNSFKANEMTKFELVNQLTNQIYNELQNQMIGQFKNQVNSTMAKDIRNEIANEILNQMKNSI